MKMRKNCLVLMLALSFFAYNTARAERIWWDGSRDDENAPPGKLLSDNAGYWGERIVTGADYSYATAPDNPADSNRRLLDGVPAGDWNTPVGAAAKPLVITFDFKRICTFSEVDICTRSQKAAFKIEIGEAPNGPFRAILKRTRDETPDKNFHRLPLPAATSGQFLRLTVDAIEPKIGNYLTYLEEVVVWGDSDSKAPETIAPVAPTPVITGVALPSIPGIARTTFSDAEFEIWKANIGDLAKLPAVWSQVSTWESISQRPLLPAKKEIGVALQIQMARNETENAALALSSTEMIVPRAGEVKLSDFRSSDGKIATKIKGELRVAGAIQSRHFGTVIGPLFESANRPGASFLRRYLTNSENIENFPKLKLSPGGSAVVWVSVESQNAAPGVYQAILSFVSSGKKSEIPLRIEVFNVTLPDPFVYLNTWDHATPMFPFVYGDRQAREVAHKQSLGMSVWHHLPMPASAAGLALQNDKKRNRTRKILFHIPILPPEIINESYNNRLKPENVSWKDRDAIHNYARFVVLQTQELGLDYGDWYGELWDEPGRGNAQLFGVLARIIKQADPKIQLYMNPIFWEGNAPASEEIINAMLRPYYRELVDISVPIDILRRGFPSIQPLFDAPHRVKATYRVSTHGDKNERVPINYRAQAWEAFTRGENGWGFYAYYRPIEDPWNDFDGAYPDYVMVYPGPRGPIPTRTSEAVRQGWEDFRLLSLLQSQKRAPEVAKLLQDFANGESPQILRGRALKIAALPKTK